MRIARRYRAILRHTEFAWYANDPRGSEQACDFTENGAVPSTGGADSGALVARKPPTDPNLAELVKAWPALPESVRAGIVALVKATLPAKE
jgi:hypothetical protein